MRLSCFLFAATTVLLASFDAISATSDADRVALSKVDSVHPASVINGNRFLRTSKVIEEDDNDSGEDLEDDTEDDSEDEERNSLLNLIKNTPLNKVDDLAADLAKVPGALKSIHNENVQLFQKIKDLGGNVILKNISGVFKPGKIALSLGQPGSGKSALMKMLSGHFSVDNNSTMEGDISFYNVPTKQIIDRLPQFMSYVDQRDKHSATLTVKETLEFAYKVCGGDITKRAEVLASLRMEKRDMEALEATKAIFANYPDVIIQQLGLQNCQYTIVDDTMIRSVSGGERKRVATRGMEFGMKYVSLMDEISTGLDSAATYDIVNTQRSVAHTLRKAVVIALLQPSPEIFSLFDDMMILDEGELMYHGPCNKVENYFETLGFKCSAGRDTADYLLDLGTPEQYQYEAEHSAKPPCQPDEFGESFRQSEYYRETLAALETPYEPELLRTVKEDMNPMPKFQ
ncbi:hypothetical protein BBO99_00008845 [Phytophthora kernoviae]|uniref:ABC transporter domain-containing protein n=2 Tax=Phytophthora kernoviae TaxID=325452 RepID=A0A3R7H0U4_9STRA|nr:hypothetical protein JM16_008896 [Phytophthora kernoviae]KAG2507441.1 hypothetical protein JM18_008717 [Phytophthora kernoviae]RLN05842.1 hypothetical protein BBI17_008859 [Phytophthora kernoviae]RLN74601.1 hypothetical protein BBO99_00008845 [Phytophthora kernoviae]